MIKQKKTIKERKEKKRVKNEEIECLKGVTMTLQSQKQQSNLMPKETC